MDRDLLILEEGDEASEQASISATSISQQPPEYQLTSPASPASTAGTAPPPPITIQSQSFNTITLPPFTSNNQSSAFGAPQVLFESQPFISHTSFLPNSHQFAFPHQGFVLNNVSAQQQQMMPIVIPVTTAADNRNPGLFDHLYQIEPPEAAVSRPLSIISLFCCCQIWFSIPAIVLAYKRNKPKSIYNVSTGLSVTAIVLGMIGFFIVMIYGISY